MTQNHVWYVSFVDERDAPPERHARRTTTFKSEQEAKQFTRTLAQDRRVKSLSAGTINPHQPKRVVGSREIGQWLGDT
ncbi:hypothetical protein H8B02_02925 [Bradyrhizobium sp. Pear77]|uniref:Uncharacterized protein n=1 Tax=Bradyrhizobium erythrophlei TaxID=1437360 RepID=A0A1H5JJ67_9BRAD|nr:MULTISPECIES: hypothetical protein [Bradyrhizobium]MCC8952448.1 hypothetical protein [Bradyrhizobium altum]SEE52509.1 hypothetical protein SAMN05444164_8461 [Bradyrhizobium erythrophlei]